MNRPLTALAVTAVAVTLAAAKVTVDSDPKADFSHRRTYAWVKGTEAPNPLVEQRIRAAVDAQLQAKGLKRVEEKADVNVSTHATTITDTRLDATNTGKGEVPETWAPGTDMELRLHTVGTLAVDLLDPATGKLIWRGIASEALGINPDPEKVSKKILKVTEKMFREFPPRPVVNP